MGSHHFLNDGNDFQGITSTISIFRCQDGEEEETDRPACFGELEFLGLSEVRKAEVKALTPCVCRMGGGWGVGI